MMSALLKSETDQTCIQDFIKASDKLGKVFDEAMIRLLVDGLSQKTATEMYEFLLSLRLHICIPKYCLFNLNFLFQG